MLSTNYNTLARKIHCSKEILRFLTNNLLGVAQSVERVALKVCLQAESPQGREFEPRLGLI